jgi:hypothetical protein
MTSNRNRFIGQKRKEIKDEKVTTGKDSALSYNNSNNNNNVADDKK